MRSIRQMLEIFIVVMFCYLVMLWASYASADNVFDQFDGNVFDQFDGSGSEIVYESQPGGTYLGEVGGSPYNTESTSNPYGVYGSRYSVDSVNNPYSVYGSRFGVDSPNNPYSTSGPRLYAD